MIGTYFLHYKDVLLYSKMFSNIPGGQHPGFHTLGSLLNIPNPVKPLNDVFKTIYLKLGY